MQDAGRPLLCISCPPVLLSSCPPVLLSSHPPVLLSSCPPVLPSSRPPVLLSSCPPVLLSSCPPVLPSPFDSDLAKDLTHGPGRQGPGTNYTNEFTQIPGNSDNEAKQLELQGLLSPNEKQDSITA
ncbi:unnamed protein product [Pleuronectes platessa]|uniref:Uncharacterized protein n=1 Tax=Pleuronectes platessa TaxID=8262 RepID=A0A9N7YGJ8_PLEPL|nr:unnamed protein product [Pleuronectes platessa]